MTALVFDAGAFIALERRDARMIATADALVRTRTVAHTSAAALAQVWRGSPRQHSIITLVRSGVVRVHPLIEDAALRVGLLLSTSGTSDVVDAHIVTLARKFAASVITSDPDDLHHMDAALHLVVV